MGRGIALMVGGLAASILAALLLPPSNTLAAVVLIVWVLFAVPIIVMMVLRFAQWVISRHAYYRTFSSQERAAAYDEELRRRGAPRWYLKWSRRERAAYTIAVFLWALSLAILHPFPGDSHFAIRLSLWALLFFGTFAYLLRARRKSRFL